MKNNLLIRTLFLSMLLGTFATQAQEASEVLWICPNDTSIKLLYKIEGNAILVQTPATMMDTSITINGELTISTGSFEDRIKVSNDMTIVKDGPVRSKTINVKKGNYSEYINYYNTNAMPTVSFKGYCSRKGLEIRFRKLDIKKDSIPPVKIKHDPSSPQNANGVRG